MIVEFNIEAEDLDSAAEYLRALIPGPREYVKTRVAVVKYEGPNGPEQNGVLIARCVVDNVHTAIGYAYQLAGAYDQDCIAMLVVGPDMGLLVGPNAAKWGEFNPEFFRRF